MIWCGSKNGYQEGVFSRGLGLRAANMIYDLIVNIIEGTYMTI